MSGGQKPRGNCLGGEFHRGQLSGVQLSTGELSRGNCPGGKSLQSRTKFMKQCQEIKQNWTGQGNFEIFFCVIFDH